MDIVEEPVVVEPPTLAKVNGAPLTEMPQDLYIPPEALSVFLDTFEGPLDLLLYLIRKHSLDILDIPMAELTRQYMGYVEIMQTNQLELAAEYLLMAALLIEIKSRMLLPRPPKEDASEDDPRAELVRRLLEYEQMKAAAQKLDAMPQAGRDFMLVDVMIEQSLLKQHPKVEVLDLKNAWMTLLMRAKVNRHHHISREELSVRAHMSRILRSLQSSEFVAFADLFEPEKGVPLLVVSFLAILELARESLIEISQTDAFEPIYVRLVQAQAEGAVDN
ncbi:MAG TPA: ScpA family protein [Burkholderiales bacterium]|nr:ScpA family protein [Burkholderiales bacterium]